MDKRLGNTALDSQPGYEENQFDFTQFLHRKATVTTSFRQLQCNKENYSTFCPVRAAPVQRPHCPLSWQQERQQPQPLHTPRSGDTVPVHCFISEIKVIHIEGLQ
jgi:hypothetical protein